MRHLYTWVFFFISLTAFSQKNQIPFKEYGVKEGLPEEYVQSIIQDDQGFMWVGTQNGLVKYDGYKFDVYGVNYNDILKLKDVSAPIETRDGKLWISSFSYHSGLSFYDPTIRAFTNFLYHPDSSKIPFPANYVLIEDLNENIWFYSYSSELDSGVTCRYNQKTNQFHHYSERQYAFRINDYLLNLSFAENEKDSSIWLFNRESYELKKFDLKSNAFKPIMKSGDTIPGLGRKEKIYGIRSFNGFLATGNYQHVFLIDPESNQVVRSYDIKSDTSITSSFRYFFDFRRNIWYSSGNNLARIDIATGQTEFYEYGQNIFMNPSEERNAKTIIPLHQDSTSIYFIVSHPEEGFKQDSYVQYMHETGSFLFFNNQFNLDDNPPIRANFSPDRQILTEDFSGMKWLGTRPNLYKEEIRRIKLYRAGIAEKELPSDTILFILEDNQHNIWISSYLSGLSKFNPTTNDFTTYPSPITQADLWKGVIDNAGNIWSAIYTYDGGFRGQGICRFDPVSKSYKTFLADRFVLHLSVNDDKIWVSTKSGILVIDYDGHIIKDYSDRIDISFQAQEVFHDSQGNTWLGDMGYNDHGLLLLDSIDSITILKRIPGDDTSLSSNEVFYVAEDNLNQIWVLTDEGLNRFEDDAFIRICQGSITDWTVDEHNNFWIGTYGAGGLMRISPESGAIKTYGEQEGLLHNDYMSYNQIEIDLYGNLYHPTYRGLSIFNPQTETFTNFTETHGLQKPSRYFTTLKSSTGEIWIGGFNGLNRIDPKKLFEKDMIPPKVWITSMTIMDSVYGAPDGEIFTKAVDHTDEIILSHWQKDLSFDFVALHYMRPEDNQYSWKLDGYDKDWSEPSLMRSTSYTNLSPDTYTFRVRGSNADGVWNNEGDFISITILPPFWATTSAYIVYVFLFIIGGYSVHRFQKGRTIRNERERIKDEQLAQAQEIEKAYQDLQNTQAQLIHAEKMASLGELTAGIAHEIQNPLNFVNNFSDVSVELVSELKVELDKGDINEAKAISDDVKDNLHKIHHHGKRASDIVKSMLQHSRAGSGRKELTDINTLADEYLRLAYHGLRAKDKSFNADFKAKLDPNLPKIKVVSQDIGRVLLNLINNAFYAVSQHPSHPEPVEGSDGGTTNDVSFDKLRMTSNKDNQSPLVVISTKKLKDAIQITVSDNGHGIPSDIKDKIFQPFFTTKGTGEGTGLGLSMSYDIVTKGHEGTLEVESEEGKGTSFIFKLPITN